MFHCKYLSSLKEIFSLLKRPIMKRVTMPLILLVALFFSCVGNAPKKETPAKREVVTFDTLRAHHRFPLDSVEPNSPALTINIDLLVPQNITGERADNFNNCIVYAAFGYEDMTPHEAVDSIVALLKGEYYEHHSAYINEKVAGDSPWFNWSFDLRSDAYEGRNGAVCYIVNYDIYDGGAHPNNVISAVNIDSESGREITQCSVLKDSIEPLLCTRLTERLAQQKGVSTVEQLQELGYLTMNDIYVTSNYLLQKDSIVFIYNNYEIAPYALGKSHIGFSYDELKDILK